MYFEAELNMRCQLAIVLLALCVFVADLSLSIGGAGHILYVTVVVLASFWCAKWVEVIRVAIVCTGMAVLGGLLLPDQVTLWQVVLNRSLSMIAVWVTVLLVIQRAKHVDTLRHERYFLTAILDTTEALVVVLDDQGRIVRVNQAWECKTRYAFAEVQGQPLWKFIGSREQSPLRQAIAALRVETSPLQCEYVLNTKHNYQRLVTWTATALPANARELTFIVVTGIDITERKRAEVALKQNEERVRMVVDNLPVAIAYVDKELRFRFVNKTLQLWLDSHGLVQNRLISDIMGSTLYQQLRPYINTVLTGQEIHFEYAVKNLDNCKYYVSSKYVPHFEEGGEVVGFFAIAEDISERKCAEVELHDAKDAAEAATRAKSEFLATMSHEIRTPMNGVIGMTGLLLDTRLTPEQREYAETIRRSGKMLLSIINDILDFSKIESGKMDLLIEKNNLYEIVSQVINVILYQSQKKNIELLLNIEPGLPQAFLLDGGRLKQILINLLGNAVKFTEKGEIELKVEKLAINDKNIKLRFSVRDTGIGIPLEKQKHIFDAFTQENSSISKRYGGTGLGLTISNNILKYMGSHLSLISAPDKGSVFYFDIEVPYEMFDLPEIDETLNLKNVLVVDDNEANRIILKDMLAYKGIESTLAANGMEALQILLKGDKFDLILMDYHMPVISGLETIEKIRELFNQRKEISPLVILHTSSEEHDVINSFRKEENSYFLLKPIKSEELYRTLKRVSQNNVIEVEAVESSQDKTFSFQKDLEVLLVDDNPVNMLLNNKILNSTIPDAILTEAENGLLALEACQKKHFSIILMDVQMPVMDGIEATKQIRMLPGYEKTPIIGVTAGNSIGEKEKCLESGMDDFLPKPLREADLLGMIKKYVTVEEVAVHGSTKFLEDNINMDMLNEYIGDDEDFKKMFLGLVVQELKLAEQNIENVVAERNIEEARRLLHKLKGTAGTAGLYKLSDCALNWEKIAEDDFDFFAMSKEITEKISVGLEIIQNINK